MRTQQPEEFLDVEANDGDGSEGRRAREVPEKELERELIREDEAGEEDRAMAEDRELAMAEG